MISAARRNSFDLYRLNNVVLLVVQCENLYEPISCLLPEVAASPAQHCTYKSLETTWVQPILLPFYFTLFAPFFGLIADMARLSNRTILHQPNLCSLGS